MNHSQSTGPEHMPVSMQVCPWWFCFTFDNILRRWLQNPVRAVQDYVKTGDRVLDIGAGMGYFTIPLAGLVGESGQVTAADLQIQMLNAIRRRAVKSGVEKRLILQQCRPDSLNVTGRFDFALAFWMVHEVPDKPRLMCEIASLLKPGGLFLLSEPKWHVTRAAFKNTVGLAVQAGLAIQSEPRIFISNSALLKKV